MSFRISLHTKLPNIISASQTAARKAQALAKKKVDKGAPAASESDIRKKYNLSDAQFDYLEKFAEKTGMNLEQAAEELQLEAKEE